MRKTTKLAAFIGLAATLVCTAGRVNAAAETQPDNAAEITGVSIRDFSSQRIQFSWKCLAVNAINGSGLSENDEGERVHSNNARNHMWLADELPAQLTVDLGSYYDLERLHVWNFFHYVGGKMKADLSAKELEIWVAPEPDGTFVQLDGDPGADGVQPFTLDKVDAPHISERLDLSGQTAADDVRLVRLVVVSNQSDNTAGGLGGLAEVRFEGTELPAAEARNQALRQRRQEAQQMLALKRQESRAEYEKDARTGRLEYEQYQAYNERRKEKLKNMAEGNDLWAAIALLWQHVDVEMPEFWNSTPKEVIERLAREHQALQHPNGDIWGELARFSLKKDVEEANRIVMETDFSKWYWASQTQLIPLYEMFNADDGHRAKLLSREATDKIHEYFWERFQPGAKSARQYHFLPDQPWESWGNQNHAFVYQSMFYIAANALKDIPKYAGQFAPVKHVPLGRGVESYDERPDLAKISLADHAENARKFFRNKLLYMARTGMWAEGLVYGESNVEGLYNLAYHADDPVIRKRASMLLDIHWLLYSLQTVDGQFGGAHNRFKMQYAGYHPVRRTGWAYFGGRPANHGPLPHALVGDYVPPQIAYDLLENPEKRGCFIHRERLPMLFGPAEKGHATWKYSYVTPEYVLGTYILQDLKNLNYKFGGGLRPWRYSERAFNGITFGKSRVMLRLGPARSFQSYHCMQHGPVLLASWYGHDTPVLSIIRREKGGAEVEKPVLEQGWVFGKAGDAYYAMRPAEGAFSIVAPENKNTLPSFEFPEGKGKIPFVVHAGGVTEDGSFEDFKQKVLDNSLSYKDGVITYTDDKWGNLRFNPTPAGQLYASSTLSSWSARSNPSEKFSTKGKVASDGEQNYVLWEENSSYVQKSHDGGKTWSDPERSYSFPDVFDLVYAFDAFPAASGTRTILTAHANWGAVLENDMPKVVAATEKTFAAGTAKGKLYTANGWKLNWKNEVTAADGADNTKPIREIAAGNGRFVAVAHDGDASVILTFPEDGNTYDKITQGRKTSFDGLLLSDVAYSQNRKVFVAAGMASGSTRVFTSSDGKEWNLTKTLNEKFLHLEWASDIFALVTLPAEDATEARAYKSVDGEAWSSVELAPKVAGSMRTSFSSDGHQFFSVVYELRKNLRQVNGEPTPLPDKLFDSPYLTSDYGSGVITAKFGDQKLIMDFRDKKSWWQRLFGGW